MTVDNTIEFAHRWFHLASVTEFLEDMDEYEKLSQYGSPYNVRVDDNKVSQSPIYDNKEIVSPIYQTDTGVQNPIYFLQTMEDAGISVDFEIITKKES